MIAYEDLYLLNEPFMQQYRESFADSLDKGWFILGNKVTAFETEFASYCGGGYCAGLASGLDALVLALKYFEFPEGSEVIVPSNTYIATILAIYNNGLVPVLVEPDINTYNIDPLKIAERITDKTRAVMVVHLYGKSCDMGTIMDIADKHGLRVIEDCAQSHGAMYRGKQTGTFGDFGAFSFYPTKNLGALGDGGALLSAAPDRIEKIKALRNYGCHEKYYNNYVGVNSRLDEIQAGFLSVKLPFLNQINAHKRKLADLYHEGLKEDFIRPVVHEDYHDVYHIYAIRHPKRDELRAYLLKHDIKTEIHYPVPPHHQQALKNKLDGAYPVSELIHQTTLSLPVSYCHNEQQIRKVIDVMNAF
ncbi:DegT/DnrJ/EryC1/StrS family aminotransferase [Pedobacter frigoris]|uniref:DegT/DnrJ/EryC1/StrS family aminotransferase n=1 Tax=Pedobacter frigoris TaxID=2571272 RepID=A0A4U1CMH9_9SPHI|nr:DegT/DnrJ/EryC1/StrS family aminotransferase [Pedobacter frigoris]TKC07581.1 DegT/DnrJ/EryC1/StrS family aminotransferase [Pedobacter frigoris]